MTPKSLRQQDLRIRAFSYLIALSGFAFSASAGLSIWWLRVRAPSPSPFPHLLSLTIAGAIVRLQPAPNGGLAGGVFGLSTVRKEATT